MPLANVSVNMAGQTSKVGGTVARVFGWIVLAAGLLFALSLGGLMALLGSTGGWILGIAGSIALITAIAAYALLRGGRALTKSGEDESVAMKSQALFALANTRGGVLRAADAAPMLQVLPDEADRILTKLAKEQPDHVTLDVDDNGNILYRFIAADWNTRQAKAIAPTMAPNAVSPNVRLAAPPMRVATTPEPAPVKKRVSDPLEDEFAQMEADAEAAAQKAR